MKFAIQRMVPRVVLEHGYYPAQIIASEVREMLLELVPTDRGFDIQTLGINGRWDALSNSFLLSAKVQEAAQ